MKCKCDSPDLLCFSTVFGKKHREGEICVLSIKESVFLLKRKGKHFSAGKGCFFVDRN
jgi:hypothetical protein